MIGWEDDDATVGPVVAAAKQSLLQLILHIIPVDYDGKGFYRLVLEPRRFRNSQYVDYKRCKRFAACDVCVRLGNGMHCARDIIRSIDGSGSRSGDK